MNMRTLVLIPLSLLISACQSAPTEFDRLDSMGETAVAFANAIEERDFAAASEHAAPSAKGALDALDQMFSMMLEREEAEPSIVVLLAAEQSGDRGIAELSLTSEDGVESLFLHLVAVNDGWGVEGFADEVDGEVQLFADREADAQEQLQRAIEETTPHPDLGPIVEAYVAASQQKDLAGMTANMTDKCKQREMQPDRAFTQQFASGQIAIDRWQFDRHEVEGDRATQRIRTILTLADGGTDGEPIRFEFIRTAAGWQIDEVN
ncbi:MAG: nuclear transport factor 2 family protein [Planctomycetota bacterium]